MQNLILQVASGEAFDIRTFNVEQEMNACFVVTVLAHSDNPDVDFDEFLGKTASFTMVTPQGPRTWTGLANHAEQAGVDEDGLSTYRITVVPTLWLLTQRRNHRMFQQMSEVDIVEKLLDEWGVDYETRLDASTYKKRKYRVQYGESDFDFMSRMLEDMGISFYFAQREGQSKLILDDGPQHNSPRPPLRFMPKAGNSPQQTEHVSSIEVKQLIQPGKYTLRDHDYRRSPTYQLIGTASGGLDVEQKLERFHYTPGAFLFRAEGGGDTPHADDRGAARTDEKEAQRIAERRLASKQARAKVASFTANAFDLAPGVVYSLVDHPRSDLGSGKPQLVVACSIHGSWHGDWTLYGTSVRGDAPFHPEVKTPKPKTQGVESATVVGPPGEEIHTDEFGRVRVQFHWDREGQFDHNSSCWIHVNQPWGGSGYGGSNLPRIGQEVLVDFLGGDPDRPMIIGRVYNKLQTTPYKLPDNKTQSGWRSNSTGNTGGFNEIMFEDKNGIELFRTHAQKDHLARVNNNSSTSIGNNRDHATGVNNTESVGNNEKVTVGADRKLKVGGKQKHTVKKDIESTSEEGSTHFVSKEAFTSKSKVAAIVVDEMLEIVCGSSKILMTKEFIMIDSPRTYINPGKDAVSKAQATGKAPLSEDEKATKQKQLDDLKFEQERLQAERDRKQTQVAFQKKLLQDGYGTQHSVDGAQHSLDITQGKLDETNAKIDQINASMQ